MHARPRASMALALGLSFGIGLWFSPGPLAAAPAVVSPPGQPTTGYGSGEIYVSGDVREVRLGNMFTTRTGKDCWYFQPETLAHGDSAPVVVFLHGFALLAPDIYDRHIEHLAKQGVIVVFPQINKGGIIGLMSDLDQNLMLERAVDATQRCLADIGDQADLAHVYLYGHSLGALLAAAWQSHPRAPAVRAAVLAHPSLDPFTGMPSFVVSLLGDRLVTIEWREAALATDVPVVILTGDGDTIAPSSQSLELRDALVNAASVSVYSARSDHHAGRGLIPDHMAPINNSGLVPSFLMRLFGGAAHTDALDFGFYWAALDAVMDGVTEVEFDMGAWSDGVPVLPVTPM